MTGTNKTPTAATSTGGRRKRCTRKNGGSATLTPAPVQAGGADLAPASFKGGDATTKVKGGNADKVVKGGNTDKVKYGGNEDMGDDQKNEEPIVGGKKSGAACDKAYCVKCKKNKMAMVNCKNVTSKNGRSMLKGNCKKCGTKMNKFI